MIDLFISILPYMLTLYPFVIVFACMCVLAVILLVRSIIKW